MSTPQESLLELQDFSGRKSSTSSSNSGGSSSITRGRTHSEEEEEVPATVSVLPLLAGENGSATSEAHYMYGVGGNGSAARGRESAIMRPDPASGEQKSWEPARGAASSSSSPAARSSSPSAPPPIVVAHNIHKTYLLGVEGVPALRGVSLSIAKGEFLMILGSSGGGKTSLLNILGTIDKPTKGDLHICGHRISSTTSDEEFAWLRLKKIGFVFQTFNLLPSMTAEENVSLPMILEGRLSAAEIKSRAQELLERVGLGERLDHLPSQLSGGEQQRVTIARAIANRPNILLLDEPTGDLDSVNGTLILSLLLHLNREESITCIMVTHDTALKTYAHRVVHMVDGKIARIEVIDAKVRQEMDENLKLKVQQIRGEWSGEIPAVAQPTTEFREAEDYESFLRPEDDE